MCLRLKIFDFKQRLSIAASVCRTFGLIVKTSFLKAIMRPNKKQIIIHRIVVDYELIVIDN